MSTTITANFEITGWDNTAYDEPTDGPPLGQATITKSYTGAVEGTGTVRMLACQTGDTPDAGAGYLAQERVTGTLDGKTGSFVLHHGAVGGLGQHNEQYGFIIPGSGTGDLKALSGTCKVDHGVLTLHYDL
ncbi:DUF3224 domain-containing protein [Actinocrispum wychmicini]|uniref:Uncharacterized protein DUF3224 n=1 Tax=Actinocrispum wychmicini TaxID=1213861 RepID=A0A4R2JNM4_9PSEU|nr:DUF3224 domain-containing protein [Actinocrispum wychmicini]TCO60924.1 uncharacterized protein DUF3224 [Actinocrispum wychmicini]